MANKYLVDLSWKTLGKLTAWALGGYFIYLLWDEILVFILACFLATAATPVLDWGAKRKIKGTLIAGIGILEILFAAAFIVYIFPPLVDQTTHLVSNIPSVIERTMSHLPDDNILKTHGMAIAKKSLDSMTSFDAWGATAAIAGKGLVGILTLIVLIYVFQIYLMIDGRRVFKWFALFFRAETRKKIEKTADEMFPVISSYIFGQLVTSVLSAIFVYALLEILQVPAAVTLAVLAGIFDILPIVGFFMSAIPAVLFAFTVSPTTALIVMIAYSAYHLFESYFLGPWIYGSRLKMSGLAVIVALIVGATFGGVLGAIIILPIAASFPIIERIWLKDYLGHETLQKLDKLEHGK